MIDTGAAPNIIKKRNLESETRINGNDTLLLSGITEGYVSTIGTAEISYMGNPIALHVVHDQFPISQEGILGSDFLQGAESLNFNHRTLKWQGIEIPFARNDYITIPARSRSVCPLRVSNRDAREGYIPRIEIGKGLYLGEALITNRNGTAYVGIVNVTENEVSIPVPTVEIGEFDETRSPTTITNSTIDKAGPHGQVLATTVQGTRYPISTDGESERTISKGRDGTTQVENRQKQIEETLRLDHLNEEEYHHVLTLITRYPELFRLTEDQLQCTNLVTHKIPTTDELPIHTKQYRYPPIHKEEIDKQVGELLKNDVIKPSVSPYNSPLWIVPKKADSKGNKKWRMVIDFRALNEKTVGDAYPLPNITEILDQLGGAKYFSVFDLASGFHQIRMDERDAQKTAFSTPHGHYEYKRMPFGLKNAPATFQRLMDQILSGLQGNELFVYLDDIVLYASSLEEHAQKFHKLAHRLREANLQLQPDKCEFLRKEVAYLGHIIGKDGVKPDPSKIQAVKEFPIPRNAKNIKQFLGLAGYYRRFIPDFAKTARPLTGLLKKEATFVWAKAQTEAFEGLRDQLCKEPILQFPDFSEPFVLTTDASGFAIGGVLSQGEIGKDLPIAYASRALNKAETNYSTIEKELLAIIYCVRHFRPYLYGRKFRLVTDHKPLVWMHSVKDPCSRLLKWRMKLQDHEYEVVYKPGRHNANADALSRNPPQKKILPISTAQDIDSDSEGSIFSYPQEHRADSPVQIPAPTIPPKIPTPEDRPASMQDQLTTDADEPSSDSDEDDGTNDDDDLFDNINEPYTTRETPGNVIEIPDNFALRKDTVVIFTNIAGKPRDEGARMLELAGKLPASDEAITGHARVTKTKSQTIISLPIQDKMSEILEKENLLKAVRALKDVCTELDLASVSICKGSIDTIPWITMKNIIIETLQDCPTKIFICANRRTVPPPSERTAIINEYHSSTINGHKGITKTYKRLKERYEWPRMKQDIQTFIRSCRNCQLKKLVRVKTKQPMLITDTPGKAFEKISMDIMGPLPRTSTNNVYILTIQDLLTKYSLAIPLKNAAAIDIADAFVNEFICIYGAPKALLTDQGANFTSSLMKNVARKFRIQRYKTTAYRPQSNGSLERSHHVLWEYLKQYVNKNTEWDQILKLATFSYNTSVHEGTRYTPHELVFGKTAEIPSSYPPIGDNIATTYAEYLTSLYNKLTEVQQNARENLIKSKHRSKTHYDRKINQQNFQANDLVYLLKEPSKGKLSDQYIGPYKIVELIGDRNVRLDLGNNHSKIVHKDKLRLDRSGDIPSLEKRNKGAPNRQPQSTSKHQTPWT